MIAKELPVISDKETIGSSVEERKVFKDSELTNEGKLFLSFLNTVNDRLFDNFPAINKQKKREIHLGFAEDAEAWTDSSGFICFNSETEINFKKKQYLKLIFILIHEYCHTDGDKQGHGLDFYEAFHNFVIRHDLNILIADFIKPSDNQIRINFIDGNVSNTIDPILERLYMILEEPTQSNLQMLNALIPDLGLSFHREENKILFGLKYTTYRSWLSDPNSKRHRNPTLGSWKDFICNLIAHRKGFKNFSEMTLAGYPLK